MDSANTSQSHIFCWQDGGNADILSYIILGICLPSTPVVIYSLCTQIKNDPTAPVFVFNLLISDLIQLCCMLLNLILQNDYRWQQYQFFIYPSGLIASFAFMLCIAAERYLAIAFPLWYRFKRTVKISVALCVSVWFFSFSTRFLSYNPSALLSVPLFLLLFFLVQTVKSLSAAQSVPSDEKKRIVTILVMVLLIYLLMFISGMIYEVVTLVQSHEYKNVIFFNKYIISSNSLLCSLLQLNPLLNLFSYFFMKKLAVDKLLAHLCCCRLDSNNINASTP